MDYELILILAGTAAIIGFPIFLITKDKREIRKELKKRGFEVIEIKSFHWDNVGEQRGEHRYDVRYKNKEGFRRDMSVIKIKFGKLDFSDAPDGK